MTIVEVIRMGRRVSKRFEHGEFTSIQLDHVPPLGEDRKTVFVPASPLEKLLSQVSDKTLGSQLNNLFSQIRGEGFAMAAMIMRVVQEKYGEEVWDDIEKVMHAHGYQRGKEFAETMKIDPTDARSIGRIFDLEDSLYGVKGEWVEFGRRRAVKREYECPFSEAAKLCPEMCTRAAAAVERGTFDAIGIKGKFELSKLMPNGDPYCEAIVEVED
jgi:predicted ArsR family transcriptional regulator